MYEPATEESGSDAEPDMMTPVPKKRAKKKAMIFSSGIEHGFSFILRPISFSNFVQSQVF